MVLTRNVEVGDFVAAEGGLGAQANAAVMLGVIQPGDKILGFDLSHGGHLTHGSPVNFSGKLYPEKLKYNDIDQFKYLFQFEIDRDARM